MAFFFKKMFSILYIQLFNIYRDLYSDSNLQLLIWKILSWSSYQRVILVLSSLYNVNLFRVRQVQTHLRYFNFILKRKINTWKKVFNYFMRAFVHIYLLEFLSNELGYELWIYLICYSFLNYFFRIDCKIQVSNTQNGPICH